MEGLHEQRMRRALHQADLAAAADEVPVGAVIYHGNRLVAQAYNQTQLLKDPTAHAEVLAITQAAAALGDWRLLDCTLYVTKEPCPMCAGAIVLARIPLVVWGADDPKRGGARSRFGILQDEALNHRPELISGILADDSASILQRFFRQKRVVQKSHAGCSDSA